MLLQRLAVRAALAGLVISVTPARAEIASWYGPGFHGRLTANGERFDQNALTAAHWTLPLGTPVRVTDLATGRHVDVRVNDRGPHPRLRRLIDLSLGAARALGITHRGLARVRVSLL
ncbi:hypothetical protein AX289_27270 [Methylorubrum populi]|nr:hypothetical protein AX289_27270 [Methylorubrum populi]